MLDEGKKLDWFSSPEIVLLFAIACIGCIAFLIWETTEDNPVVNLQVFRNRGFSISVLAISLTLGAFFGSIVITPLWLQTNMGYTATWSGLTMAANGVLAIFIAPFVAKLAGKTDLRKLASFGVIWLGLFTFIRSFGDTDMTYSQITIPILIQGGGMPFFFIPLSALALSCVPTNQIFLTVSIIFIIAAIIAWTAPKPKHLADNKSLH